MVENVGLILVEMTTGSRNSGLRKEVINSTLSEPKELEYDFQVKISEISNSKRVSVFCEFCMISMKNCCKESNTVKTRKSVHLIEVTDVFSAMKLRGHRDILNGFFFYCTPQKLDGADLVGALPQCFLNGIGCALSFIEGGREYRCWNGLREVYK